MIFFAILVSFINIIKKALSCKNCKKSVAFNGKFLNILQECSFSFSEFNNKKNA